MLNTVFIRQSQKTLALILAILLFSGFQPAIKQNADIILKDEPLSVIPTKFYIANVIDERDNRTAVALLLPAVNTTNTLAKPYPVDLHGGGFTAIRKFIDHSLPANKTLPPVVIRLKKFMDVETALTGRQVEGNITLIMAFDLEKEDKDMEHLADYEGSAKYIRTQGPAQDIEPTLRHMLENGLIYLNTWMDKQADTNIKLAKGVKVSFYDYTEKPEGDSIYYSVNRPLVWDDFQSKIPSGKYDAEVFPVFGYEEHTEIAKGIINIRLGIKVCLPKSACWARTDRRTAYALNHEQRHFDITKIVAEHFKQKIKAEHLPVGNFDGPINVEYLESYREMHNLQKQYDDETDHGTNQLAQQKWNERIDKELNEYGVK